MSPVPLIGSSLHFSAPGFGVGLRLAQGLSTGEALDLLGVMFAMMGLLLSLFVSATAVALALAALTWSRPTSNWLSEVRMRESPQGRGSPAYPS